MHHIPRRRSSPRHTTPRKRTLMAAGVAAGLCVALLFASSGQAAGGKTTTLRIFEKAASIRLTKSDGTVLNKLPIAETEPKAGDVLDLVFDDFVGNHARHAKKPSGSDHLRCTFVASGPPSCVSHVAFGSSMLVIEGNPGRVALGTGRYRGATGRVVSSHEVKHAPPSSLAHNNLDIVARIHLK
jgi:hypothetical protein